MDKLPKIEFKKIKVNNIVAIGGMIAAGKTTLVDELSAILNADVLYELDENDEIQNSLLKGLYEKRNIAASVFQLYFLLNRFESYKKFSNHKKPVIVDRTIFEDRLFAHQNMTSDPLTFSFYDKLWYQKANELIYECGVPKLYIILDIDWITFKERLFKRNRAVEVENFNLNEDYFYNLNQVYVKFLKETCEVFGIDYLILDAKISNEDKINKILEHLKTID